MLNDSKSALYEAKMLDFSNNNLKLSSKVFTYYLIYSKITFKNR